MAQGTHILNVLTGKMIVSEIVQTITGCIGLIVVTPLIALFASYIMTRRK